MITRKLAVLLGLGFASGLPYLLVGSTLSARLRASGVDLSSVGWLSLVALPYSLKFAWAPLVDRFAPPWLGRRRGWLLPLHAMVALLLIALGRAQSPTEIAIWALACAVASATVDLCTDAYQTDVLDGSERAPGAAATVLGYRAALLVGGGAALFFAARLGWPRIYALAAALLTIGVVAVLLAPEPRAIAPPATLAAAVVDPFRAFFARGAAVEALVFLTFYRLGDTAANVIVPAFLVDKGFTLAEIGAVQQVLGIGATIVGTALGGALVSAIGLPRALFGFGILGGATNLAYAALAFAPSRALLITAVLIDQLCAGLVVAAAVAFIIALCDRRYSATQFALLTSVAGIGGRLISGGSGVVAARVGWPIFFLATAFAVAPALLLLPRILRRRPLD